MTDLPPPVAPAYAAPSPREHPQSTLVLILGILSILCCGIFTGVPGIIIGSTGLREVKASGGALSGSSLKAGLICSIIGTAWMVLIGVVYVVIVIVAVIVGNSNQS